MPETLETAMQLREALSQIDEIRSQMHRGQIFRGFRSATAAFSGILALLAGLLQPLILKGSANPAPFLILWLSAAAISLIVVAAEMTLRTRRSHSPLQRQLTLLAVEQFTPSIVAGALLTCVFVRYQLPIALLPGLWMILFSLGIFALARLLPRPVFAVAGFYLIAGIFALVMANRGLHFAHWLMTITFAAGQFAAALILYFRLERTHA
jgi:hypothetical protein